MQPNFNIPQAPYVMYPSYRLPRTSVIDMSVNALMEHKIREVQNANRQQAVASRTPTVLFDPLLNLRVRDYYREKYQRSLGTEVAGRTFGAVEGAALGLGIASTIAGIIIAGVSLLETTPVGEAVGGTIAASGISAIGNAMPAVTGFISGIMPAATAAYAPFLVGAGTIGAGVGGTAGLIGSDYTTYYATRDMFSNLIMPQSVGAGVLNSMNFVGQTMDMVGTGTVIKSTLYALINNESIAETIARAYGLHPEGRMEMNFSDIRESLGLDFGGVGNFFVDIAGEFSTDIGAIAGISPLVTGRIARKATAEVAENTAKAINKAGTNIFSEGFFKTKAAKPFLKSILDNDVDSFIKLTKSVQEFQDLDKEVIQKFFNSVTKDAIKKTSVKVSNMFKTIDVVDDFLTSNMWKISNPVIAGVHAVNKIKDSSFIPKTLGKVLTDEKIYKILKFFQGNQTVYHKIMNMMPEQTAEFLISAHKSGFNKMLFGNTSYRHVIDEYANSILDINERKAFLDYLNSSKVNSMSKLKKDSIYFERIKEFFSNKYNSKKSIVESAEKELEKLSNGKIETEEQYEMFLKKYKEYTKLESDEEYIRLGIIMKHLETPEEYDKLASVFTNIYSLHDYSKQHSLKPEQNRKLESSISEIIQAYVEEHRTGKTTLVSEYFDQFYKPIKKFIMDNMSSETKKMVTDYFEDSVSVFNTESARYSYRFREAYAYTMKERIHNNIDSQPKEIKQLYKKFLEDFEKADDADKRYRLVNNFLNSMVDVDKTLPEDLSRGQDEMLKLANSLKKFGENFKTVITNPPTVRDPIRYTIFRDSDEYAKARRKYTDEIIKLFNSEIPEEVINNVDESIRILEEDSEFINRIIGLSLSTSNENTKSIKSSITLINEIIGGVYKLTPTTAQLTRLLYRAIPKFMESKMTKGYDEIYKSISTIKKAIGGKHKAYPILRDMEELFSNMSKTDDSTVIKYYNNSIRRFQKQLADLINKDYINARNNLQEASKSLRSSLVNVEDKIIRIKDKLESYSFTKENILEVSKAFKGTNVFDEYTKQIKAIDTVCEKLKKSLKKQIIVKHSLEDLLLYSESYSDGFTAIAKYIDSFDNIDYKVLVKTALDSFINDISKFESVSYGKFIDQYSISYQRLINLLSLANVKYDNFYNPLIKYLGKFTTDITNKDVEILSKVLREYNDKNEIFFKLQAVFNNKIPLKIKIIDDKVTIGIPSKTKPSIKKLYQDITKSIQKTVKHKDSVYEGNLQETLENYLKALPQKEELMNSIMEEDPELYKYLLDISQSPKKIEEIVNNVSWRADEIFKDLYNQGPISAYAYTPKSFKNKPIFGSTIVIFDTETTGSSSNGLYSLTAKVMEYNEFGEANILETKSFYLKPDAKEWGQWTIDPEVDNMYKKQGGVLGVVREMNLKNQGTSYNTSRDLANDFKYWLDNNYQDSVLIAHNASFDFNQFMNTMSGGLKTDEVTGNILPNAAKEFADTNGFNYAILDSNLMQNFLYLVGNPVFTTNTDMAMVSKYIDTLEIRKLSKDNIVILFNGKQVSAQEAELLKSKSKNLLTLNTTEDGTEAMFNGGDLHEATHDVNLMSLWTQEMFDKLGEMGVTLSDLKDTRTLFNKVLDRKHSQFIKSKEFRTNIKNIQSIIQKLDEMGNEDYSFKQLEELREALKVISSRDLKSNSYEDRMEALEIISDYIEYSRKSKTNKEIINEDALENITPTYARISTKGHGDKITRVSILGKDGEFVHGISFNSYKEATEWIKNNYPDTQIEYSKNVSTSYFTSQTILSENDDFILNNEELYNLINAYDMYDNYDNTLNKQINVYKKLRGEEEAGKMMQNRAYTMFKMAEVFTRDSYIRGLVDLLNGNKNKTLSGELERYASLIEENINREEFIPLYELKNELMAFEESAEWYDRVLKEINPAALDAFDNVISMIENGKKSYEIRDYIINISELNKFNKYEMFSLYEDIITNQDKVKRLTASNINHLYMKFKDNLTSIIKRQEGNPENIRNDLPSQQYAGKDVIELVDNAFISIRNPLREAKAKNRMYSKMPLTMKEINHYSRLSETDVSNLRSSKYTNFDYGPEFKFTNGIHTLQPTEAVYRNSRNVIKFNDDIKQGMDNKRKFNKIISHLFKETEERAQDLPLVDARHSRLFNMVHLAAKSLDITDKSFINAIYNFGAYKEFSKYNNLFQDMYNAILKGEIPLEEVGLNRLVFSEFVKTISGINETSFSYINDPQQLKNVLINSLMYHIYKNNPSEKASMVYNTKLFNINNKDAYAESLKLFKDTVSVYTDMNGNIDTDGFISFFKNHPEYNLVFLDNKGEIHKLRPSPEVINSPEFKKALLGNSTISIMSEDLFTGLAKDIQSQEIKNPVFNWMRNHLLRNLKVLSLVNMNFMPQNAMAAAFQNIISTEGKIDIPKFISGMGKTIRNYHKYNKIMLDVTSSNAIKNFTGTSVTSIETMWTELIENEDFLNALVEEGNVKLVNTLRKLSKKDIQMLKDYSKYTHTSAAYGEVNSITRNKQRDLKAIAEAEQAAKDLKEKYDIDFSISNKALRELEDSGKYTLSEITEIKSLRLTALKKKYDNMSTAKLKKELSDIKSDIEKRGKSYKNERRQIEIINSILNNRQYDISNNLFKYLGITKYLNINNDMETIFRLSAIENYIEQGMTLDQATYEVIKRQFLYNDKSQAEQYAEFFIPFISYPLRMVKLVETMTHDSTVMDLLFWMNMYSWDDEEDEQQENSEYLTKRRARGDIPIGDKLVQFGSPFNEGIMNFQNPLYSLNNKLNPLMKPFVDLATDEEHVRWNHLPGVSQVDTISNIIKERNIMNSFVNDFYRYNQFGNYYRPRINNKITGTFYNNLYTRTGKSRISMDMQPLNSSNLKYRINDILYSGPKR